MKLSHKERKNILKEFDTWGKTNLTENLREGIRIPNQKNPPGSR